ncbi:A-deaminase domain-containing protein [Aphelenchoides besseyi]|nr:A-deaminase domain-containing protein [Aphelenchoides besseyi]
MGQLASSPQTRHSSTNGSRFQFPKVQLHCHLDGSIRFETILDIANKKQIDLRGAKTVDELKSLLVTREPKSLAEVLSAFDIFIPVFVGDVEAIERVAFELCEDMAACGVIYFEGRYSANMLSTQSVGFQFEDLSVVSPSDVVEAVWRGFQRGEREFDIKARSILCCIRAHDVWNKGIIELAQKHEKHGVVAIDAAGCSHGADEKYEPSVVEAFHRAKELGIHRTVHAGESSGAMSVIHAVEQMKVERVGHGYHIVDDPEAYKKYALEQKVHLEACPLSSVMTGAVPADWPQHPIVQWAIDGANFSINTDDSTCFDNSTESELILARDKIGLTEHQLWKCQLNGAESCFLPDDEKSKLVDRIRAAEPSTS